MAVVEVVAAEAGERAVHQIAAGPVHAEQQRRTGAVVIARCVVTLRVAAQVRPPMRAVFGRLHRHVRGDHLRARLADQLLGVRQQCDLARRFEHRDRVLAEDRVRGARGMHAVGEHVGVRGIRRHQRARVARQRVRGDLRLARGAGGVGETVGLRRGDDFPQQVERVERNHAQALRRQRREQRGVVGRRQLRAAGGRRRALCEERRRRAEIRHGGHEDVLRAGVGQRADVGRPAQPTACGHRRLRGRAAGDREQVVRATPHRVQRARIGDAAGRGEIAC